MREGVPMINLGWIAQEIFCLLKQTTLILLSLKKKKALKFELKYAVDQEHCKIEKVSSIYHRE